MRFRSLGISASNIDDYLSKLKERETDYGLCYIEDSTLAHISFITLDEKGIDNDEYEFLGAKSNYKMKKYKNNRKRRNKKRIISTQYFRKKIFFHHKRKRINSESINIIKTNINLFE